MSKRVQLLELLKDFARSIDNSIEVVDGFLFESDMVTREVFVDLDNLHSEDDDVHLQAMRELGYLLDINLYTYSFLHEIGHIMSSVKYSQIVPMLRQYRKQVDKLEDWDAEDIEVARAYKRLRLERDADEYAYQYYLHNYESVKELDQAIQKLLS